MSKNSELEAQLAASFDEIREHEEALLEISELYRKILKKYNDLKEEELTKLRKKKVKKSSRKISKKKAKSTKSETK